MAILNWLARRTVYFTDSIVRKYVVEIPRLDEAQKAAAKKALRRAVRAGAEYGATLTHEAAKGMAEGAMEKHNG